MLDLVIRICKRFVCHWENQILDSNWRIKRTENEEYNEIEEKKENACKKKDNHTQKKSNDCQIETTTIYSFYFDYLPIYSILIAFIANMGSNQIDNQTTKLPTIIIQQQRQQQKIMMNHIHGLTYRKPFNIVVNA